MLLALFSGNVHAQTRSITGNVIDDASDEPVSGVTIRVKGGPQSAVTDAKGSFTLNVPTGGGELEYSHVGYEIGTVIIPAEGPLVIRAKKLNISMDDVVVIGYGTQKRSQLTGAVASIKGQEIQDVPSPNIAGALRVE
ncbi:carboxypeptidase-like regulatory domain-containing protein [Niabella sp. W65]|nr:carboxypeptidase-like regulatory domain-containing protein [Niabella sp. W65]MCH7365653.1 carboxypeptidase-like regulatory domain-containing protein [Niabella sp. W65]